MATKPLAWQDQGPLNTLEEGVNEFWAQGVAGATKSHDSPLQDKEAPRAESEEDINVQEPGAQEKTQQENQTLSPNDTAADATESENQELTRICVCTHRETQEMVTELEQAAQLSEALQAQEESEKSTDPCEDAFPPPPAFISAPSTEECFEKESFSSLEGEVAAWISDAEIISDPIETPPSPVRQISPEGPPLLPEPVNRETDSSPEEMTGDNMRTEENGSQLNVLQDSFNSEPDNMSRVSAAAINSTVHHSPSDRNNSDDECSAPFADKSKEKVSIDIMSCQQQSRSKSFEASYSAFEQDPTSSTVPSVEHQEELLSQSPSESAPRGENQEAAQQVHGQSSSPLSTVAMELCKWGGAASQGPGCLVAVRERHSGAGESAEGESKQTGGEGGQRERGLERNRLLEQQHSGGLLTKTDRAQEVKPGKHSFVYSKHTRMESDSYDDSQSDSGVSADFSPCSTLEGNTTISPAAAPKETPIEREIRRAIEREHSLRRSRGLPNPPTAPEYVEIPLRKTVQSITLNSERCQGKDRQFAGKKMQQEIHEETQREQDLVKLGTVPGFYDKGTVRQLKDRKQLFEAFQKPDDSTLSLSARSQAMSWSSVSDISTLEDQEDISSQASTIRGSHVERIHTQSQNLAKGGGTPRGAGYSEGKGCQVIILENNLSVPALKLYHAKPEAQPVTVVDSGRSNFTSSRTGGHDGIQVREPEKEEVEDEGAPKENPFFKLRSSTNLVKVENDIREAQEREKELHKQRVSLYGGTEGPKGAGGSGGPVIAEGKTPTLSSSSLNGLAVPELPVSSSRGGTRPTAARQSVGRLGMWPPPQSEEEKINRPEVLQGSLTPRQKTSLVQRWESGLVNGHNTEDD
ncbi:hypothetical protein F7725_005607 [Dissostichus mawsoni]|uniref:A-kinase anchor protein 2 C-terminal domain-containing protein n=1 Tax=Dissostichus mawsoni TaxID=36200 RepID=A0A7J5YRQ4_DISMA|nr:hypothetical protein F7725_005607 [Dissostichus mawsoni]